ncbi:1-phosphofructokinase family hexose kinase [Microbacterium kribbense]
MSLPGGKSINVARALHTLGVASRVIAPLGGAIGDSVRVGLEASGIASIVVPIAAETRLCVSIVDDHSGASTEVYDHPTVIDDSAWKGILTAVEGVAGGWLAVSGSVPAARRRDLGDALAGAVDRGVHLALDVTGDVLTDALVRAHPAVVKVNRDEAAELLGDADARSLARDLHAAGAATAVVTDGAAGAIGVDPTGQWRARPPVRGRFAIGSGDSFLAGLLSSLCAGPGLADALRAATAAGAANTLTPGAGCFSAADASRFASDVTVTDA